MRTHFEECTMKHIPREKNIKVDALSQFASSEAETYTGNVYFEVLKAPSINVNLVAPITQETSWMAILCSLFLSVLEIVIWKLCKSNEHKQFGEVFVLNKSLRFLLQPNPKD